MAKCTVLEDEVLNNKTIEKKYRSVLHVPDTFEKAWWYLDLSGNLYEIRTQLKKDGFRWNPETRVWWKSVRTENVPIQIQKQHKSEYIAKLHTQGLTYPLAHPKCLKKGCNEKKKTGYERCSTCEHEEKIKGGLVCFGWMSNKCKYESQLTIKGAICCQGCYNDSLQWAKTNPFGNDNS